INPVGLLFCSAVLGTLGLFLLGMPFTNTAILWLGAVTVYGIGKTFYWPTMLGVISERYPRGGALALGISGGIGMISAGFLGGPMIGYKQDLAASTELKREAPATYDRYRASEPTAPLPFLTPIAGLDNARVGVLRDQGKQLATDLQRVQEAGTTDKNLEALEKWWVTDGKPNLAVDEEPVKSAELFGGKKALTWTASAPAAVGVCYLVLLAYFRLAGGYKQVHITPTGEQEEDATAYAGAKEGV